MRYKFRFLLLVSIFLFPTLLYASIIAPARVTMMNGEILFRTPESEEWLAASVNTPLDEGDSIWSPTGAKAEIQLSDGTVLRLDGSSQLDLIANEDGFTHLHLANGKLYIRTAQGMAKNSMQIDADDTTVIPAARTRLRIDMLANSQEDVAIYKGSAYVEGNGNRTTVRAGELISLEEGHQEVSPLNPTDAWERWNKERDLLQSRRAKSSTPLPEELKSYAHELDSNGRWENVSEYGMVWRPTVILSTDWAPYRAGRWIWKGDDYVWISNESWGWVPYHFGRWAVIEGLGWCWVPPVRGDIYWGPGYVGWHRAGNTIGWTPLAPGELFYGRRYYGTHSVNITTTAVNQANVTYRNKKYHGGLTIVGQNDFLHGRIVSASPSSSVSVSLSIGSPRIQPLRETRMPIVKQTPPRIAPSISTHKDNRELRNRFPRIIPTVQHSVKPEPRGIISRPEQSPVYREKTVIHPAASPEKSIRHEQPEQPRQEYQQPSLQQRGTVIHKDRNNTTLPSATPPQHGYGISRGEGFKQDKTPRDGKQKRVWKITTKEQVEEKTGKEEKKGFKEQRGK